MGELGCVFVCMRETDRQRQRQREGGDAPWRGNALGGQEESVVGASQGGWLPGKAELALSLWRQEWGGGSLAGGSKRQERQACPQRRPRAGSTERRGSQEPCSLHAAWQGQLTRQIY